MKISEKIIDSQIISLFPTPIYMSKLNRELTTEEILFINENKLNSHNNEGNIGSNNNYILNNKIFKCLKEELNLIIKDYFDKIICSFNDITPYITQSWLNFTDINQYHHKHTHSNSLVSGVFYINCDEKFDNIKFLNDKHQTINLEVKEFNLWNSSTWTFPVKTKQIILFPSSLNHMVEIKEGNNLRVSLAFNVFIKGKIGSKQNLTELIL